PSPENPNPQSSGREPGPIQWLDTRRSPSRMIGSAGSWPGAAPAIGPTPASPAEASTAVVVTIARLPRIPSPSTDLTLPEIIISARLLSQSRPRRRPGVKAPAG